MFAAAIGDVAAEGGGVLGSEAVEHSRYLHICFLCLCFDGKKLAERICAEVVREAAKLPRKPCLAAVLVGDDPASEIYVRNKERDCLKCGIDSRRFDLPAGTAQEELLSLIDKLNRDGAVDGILANCYASDKQIDKAIDTFKKAAKATDVPALCAEYLFQAGVLLESQKKNNEALEIYQQIKADYPTAPLCSRQQQGNVVMDAMIDKYIEKLSK